MRKLRGLSSVLYLKYGSGLVLLGLDLVILSLCIADIAKIQFLEISYPRLVRSESLLARFDLGSLVMFLAMFFLPVLLTMTVNFYSFRLKRHVYYRHSSTSRAKSGYLVLHIVIISAFVVHREVIPIAERVSGMCGAFGNEYFCFTPSYQWLRSTWPFVSGVILLPLFGLIARDFLRSREFFMEFDFWRLIGSVGEYQPAYGDEIIYVNSASMAPSIRSINFATAKYHHKYQRAVPTSDAAKNILRRKGNDARALLYKYLVAGDERLTKELTIEFFAGTSRALEAGILRIGDISHVVLSHYEHPSQVDVVKWLCRTHAAISYSSIVPPSPIFFEEQWATQRASVIEAIDRDLKNHVGERVAIVLSEVHYVTGIYVKVEEIMEELRGKHEGLTFIIDGSQAVGNLRRPFTRIVEHLRGNDFYYFSAHKWLLSPNTCGVLISKGPEPEVRPYDMYGFDLPTATIDPNTILGLASALEFLFDSRGLFDKFHEKSVASKTYFESLVGEAGCGLEVLKSTSAEMNVSLYLAIKPRFGYKWKHNMRLFWEKLRSRGIDLTVIPETEPYFDVRDGGSETEIENYLLRVSFPYFLIGRNIKSLVRQLNDLIVRNN